MAVNFLNVTRKEFIKKHSYLYRYTTIERTLELLKEEILVFRNPEQWNDPFEKLFITATFNIDNKVYASPLKGKIYSICFTGTANNEAFWNTYTPNRDGIRIKIRTSTLLSYLEQIADFTVYIGKADYKLTSNITFDNWEKERDAIINGVPNHKFISLMLQKRKAFKYENEYRIILVSKKQIPDQDIGISIKLEGLVSTLLLHPITGQYTECMLKDYFNKEFSVRVSKSVLYKSKSIEYTLTT